jgi:hypothetical protein
MSWRPTVAAKIGQKRSACSIIRTSALAVLAEERADERVRRRRHLARLRKHAAVEIRGGDVRGEHPDGGAEERHVHLEPVAGSLALEEGGRDATGDRHAADEVAERGPLLERRLPGVERRSAMPPRAQNETPS